MEDPKKHDENSVRSFKVYIKELQDGEELSGSFSGISCKPIEDTVKNQVLTADYRIQKLQPHVFLKGSIKGSFETTCCRCLEAYTHKIDIPIDQVYENDPEEIDIADEVSQLLVLNLPLKPLCTTDCAGICQICGVNHNKTKCGCKQDFKDPRWDKLKGFIKK